MKNVFVCVFYEINFITTDAHEYIIMYNKLQVKNVTSLSILNFIGF